MMRATMNGRLPQSLRDALAAREAIRQPTPGPRAAPCALCAQGDRSATYGGPLGHALAWCRACGRTWVVGR